MPSLLDGYEVPGVSVALVSNGRLVWAAGYGSADPKTGRRVTPETVFAVNSVSMPVTAWGIMRLVEQGIIDLDVPIESFITRWRIPPSSFDTNQVTVRRLLSHTSGISPAGFNPRADSLEESLQGPPPWGPPAILERQAGEFVYSEHNYTILQIVLEEVTGKSFAAFMQKEVLQPLDMEASYEVSWDLALAAAVTQAFGDQRRLVTNAVQAPFGLSSTAPDIARFIAAHFPNQDSDTPGRGVVSPESIGLMVAPAVEGVAELPFSPPVSIRYGLGYVVEASSFGSRLISHFGYFAGWMSNLALLPESGMGIVVLSNGDKSGPQFNQHILCEWLAANEGDDGGTCGALFDVYVVRSDGSEPKALVADSKRELHPRWSPNGNRIVFERGLSDVYTINSDGSDERRATRGPDVEAQPAWSPDGTQIAYTSTEHGNADIYVMEADGSSARRLTRDAADEIFPSWSPDGDQIAFLHRAPGQRGAPSFQLGIVDVKSGSQVSLITAGPGSIDWSPDGKQIAFARDEDIHTISLADGSVQRLTSDGRGNRDPAWSPDGRRIAFSKGDPRRSDIYVMASDGSDEVVVVGHPADDMMPDWAPDGTSIIFVSSRRP
jgi:CubicO group peptidase (beta-lactamase class C family)